MRKTAIWCIPGTFFLIACVLNLVGCIQGTNLPDLVKPALLPLLTATTLAFLLGRDIPDLHQVARRSRGIRRTLANALKMSIIKANP